MRPTALYYHPDLALYDLGMDHPFRGDRFEAFRQSVRSNGFEELHGFEVREAPRATDADLETVHDPRYLRRLDELARAGGHVSLDTPVNPGMLEGGRRIFGSALAAADSVMADPSTICVTLGGLHHAGVANGEGFCVYNDVAGAARRLLDRHGLERVMVIDTDAHHGNGTMDILYEEPRVLFLSVHQSPETLYPQRGWTHEIGRGAAEGHSVNVPLPPGSTRAQYERVWSAVVRPVTQQFHPQVIIQNGGCDPLWDDPLTGLQLDMIDFEWLGDSYARLARSVDAPLISMFLSGYSTRIVQGWLAILRGIVEPDFPMGEGRIMADPPRGHEPSAWVVGEVERTIRELREYLSPWWKL